MKLWIRTSTFNFTAGKLHKFTEIFYQSINQSMNQPINESINQSINQSFSQSINRPIDRSIDQSINQSHLTLYLNALLSIGMVNLVFSSIAVQTLFLEQCFLPFFISTGFSRAAEAGDGGHVPLPPQFSVGDVPPLIPRRKKNRRKNKEKEGNIKKNTQIAHRQQDTNGPKLMSLRGGNHP